MKALAARGNPYRECAAPKPYESPSPTCRPEATGFSCVAAPPPEADPSIPGCRAASAGSRPRRWPRLSLSPKSPPASLRRSRSNPRTRNEKNSPRLWLAEEETVVGPPLFQRIPAQSRDDRRGRRHRLRPAVQAHITANAMNHGVGMIVHRFNTPISMLARRDDQAGGHEAFDVATSRRKIR